MKSNQMVSGEGGHIELLEKLYQQYQTNPLTLDSSWRRYFEELDGQTPVQSTPVPVASLEALAQYRALKVQLLMEAYRSYGHLLANVNPLSKQETAISLLDPSTWGFQPDELDELFPTHGLLDKKEAPLREILERLKAIYCQGIGFEYKGLRGQDFESWMQQRIEKESGHPNLSMEDKHLLLQFLNRSDIFESFLQTKYVGQKRFSLEGGETLIPMLAAIIERGSQMGVEEIVLGMAHRGRLNVLTNLLNKSYAKVFAEFDDVYIPESFEGTGDVKYHKGYAAEALTTRIGKKMRISLTPNPSHLESVDPVVEGQVHAKQFLHQDEEKRTHIIPILIHGDAALAGQGVVYETMQLYNLPGYTTGGTVHLVINNQIGFTTLPKEGRSTLYCTDIARAFGAPVFHVNAEDPESCFWAAQLAIEIRQTFHCDVFLDINCYRKYGHNETDEPAFTQPLTYSIIRKRQPIRELYREALIHQGVLEKQLAEQLEEEFKQALNEAHQAVQKQTQPHSHKNKNLMHLSHEIFQPFETGVSRQTLVCLAEQFCSIPEGFQPHPKLEHLFKERLSMAQGVKPIDWGMAEYLAYAALVAEGRPVRLSGQDSGRGTFSHRHALWVDQKTEAAYFPLNHLQPEQTRFEVINSSLSEMAVLGFEYGYSLACRHGLTIWEAQFGDFSNGAQVIIDQFIVSGEQKWGQTSGLTLFLPHGYEGQGPEHSSGRLERFLSLAGHDNIQVVNPTTPAQLFHLLRRQALRSFHKPLIVFTPKGLLRHPSCISSLEELENGAFKEILDDPYKPLEAKRLVLCSGRIYYDLLAEREKQQRKDIAILRIEQLYPLHQELLQNLLHNYTNVEEYLWVQEEHRNMGAWPFIHFYLDTLLPQGIPVRYVGRQVSASPATGSHSRHVQEHANILNQVFAHEK